MPWLIAKKLEMTRVIKEYKFIPITLLQIPVLRVIAKKTIEKDGYSAFSVWVVDSKEEIILKEWKNSLKLSCFSEVREFFCTEDDLEKHNVWDEIWVDILDWVTTVTIEWISKWKWFAWAMKRWNFSWGPWRVWSKFHRALGSIGNRKPRRTKPGKKMHGHMWDDKITLKNIPLEIVNKELNVIWVRWWIPGGRNSSVKIILN